MMIARGSEIEKKEMPYFLENRNIEHMTPSSPPWKLIPPFQISKIDKGFSIKYQKS
jgi:hypothetical protein